MSIDRDIARICNFFLRSPEWVQQEVDRDGEAVRSIRKLSIVPDASGVFWMHGVVLLPSGRKLDGVFVVDTDSGGELLASYWRHGDEWYSQDDVDLPAALGLSREEMFPYDYALTVPLEKDIYHS